MSVKIGDRIKFLEVVPVFLRGRAGEIVGLTPNPNGEAVLDVRIDGLPRNFAVVESEVERCPDEIDLLLMQLDTKGILLDTITLCHRPAEEE